MELDLIFGYAGAVFTGLVLGLLGGGAALFSIPVLVYFFHLEPSVATGYSLFLVGIAATSGALQNIRKQTIDYRAALFYGIPSMLTVYVVRRFIIHQLPDVFFSVSNFSFTKDFLILSLLSVVMIAVSFKMIRSDDANAQKEEARETSYPLLIFYAMLIGLFVGLVGAGGGIFMSLALVYFANLPMKKAIGTSLLLVAVNSFIGFLGDVHSNQNMDWKFLAVFSVFSVSGVFAGTYIARFVDNRQLKKIFGWFMLFIALFILGKELLRLC